MLLCRDLCIGLNTHHEGSYQVSCECNHEASIMRRPWPTRDCSTMVGGLREHCLTHYVPLGFLTTVVGMTVVNTQNITAVHGMLQSVL